MYSIITIIYGTYLPDDHALQGRVGKLLDEDRNDGDEWGVENFEDDIWTQMYHGSSEGECAYIGVKLDEFQVTSGGQSLESLGLHPNATEVDEAEALVNQLPQSVRDLLPSVGVHFFFSTS